MHLQFNGRNSTLGIHILWLCDTESTDNEVVVFIDSLCFGNGKLYLIIQWIDGDVDGVDAKCDECLKRVKCDSFDRVSDKDRGNMESMEVLIRIVTEIVKGSVDVVKVAFHDNGTLAVACSVFEGETGSTV